MQDIYGEIMGRMRPCQEYSEDFSSILVGKIPVGPRGLSTSKPIEVVEFMKPIELGYSNIQLLGSLVYIGLWLITVNYNISLVRCRTPAKTTGGL